VFVALGRGNYSRQGQLRQQIWQLLHSGVDSWAGCKKGGANGVKNTNIQYNTIQYSTTISGLQNNSRKP